MTAGHPARRSIVALAMIVRNQAEVVERCIASVRRCDRSTTGSIVDTGSTDGTQEVVERALEGLPCTLHQ